MVYVQNPGSVNMNFCTFRHANVIFQHVNASTIQNCEFSQTDSAAITVEGYPKEERNWTYASMISKIMSTCSLRQKTDRHKSGEPKSAISSTGISLSTGITKQQSAKLTCDTKQESQDSVSKSCDQHRSCDQTSHSKSGEMGLGAVGGIPSNIIPKIETSQHPFGSQSSTVSGIIEDNAAGQSIHSLSTCKSDAQCVNKSDIQIKFDAHLAPGYTTSTLGSTLGDSGDQFHHKIARIHNFVSDCAKYSNTASCGDSIAEGEGDRLSQPHSELSKSDRRLSYELPLKASSSHDENELVVPNLDLHLLELGENVSNGCDNGEGSHGNDGDGTLRERSLSSSDVSLHSASGSDIDDDENAQRGYMTGM